MRKGPYDEWVLGAHACADRVKCTCLTRAPAAVGVLMAFGCAPRDGLPAALANRISIASHK